ncbi:MULTISPECIES: CDP-glycerol glycerophosphotransferase family protein [Campylobacter]|uniref:CDP-glycerol--glycerophosphate glycerophosphotransferase n=1 Tax=Campylobacter jejuni TaxID=197 RepID=A0A431C1D7_CAMJU|nr:MULTISPECIES: CDP-glycerol glycerophosphotransferase family protein [Campylobacter]RTJ47334.1 hypothetical protein C3H68_04660 [Campylobacter jejuni]RTJ78954.1 hypothetical protein C3H57_06470 [Campylobacter jejuni]TEY07371.1 hypothetical protein ELQ12_06625 [Campylobacter sp. US25a]
MKYRLFFLSLCFNCLYYLFCLFAVKNSITLIFNKTSYSYLNLNVLYSYISKKKKKVIKIESNANFLIKIWKIAKSQVIFVDQADYIISRISLSSDTKLVQLWHAGGAYKMFGFDAKRNNVEEKQELDRIKRIHGQYSYIVISDKKLETIMANAYMVNPDKILSFGLARTDIFFKEKENFQEIKDNIKRKMHLNDCAKIVLYCPTFRINEGLRDVNLEYLNDVREAFKSIFINGVVLYRDHPSITRNNKSLERGVIDVSTYDNIYELFLITDILITDYSSIIFDYSFFKKPIILYIPDIESYVNNDRKLYYSPYELVGKDMVANNITELITCIANANYNVDLWSKFMKECDGRVCEKIFNYFCE